MNKGKALVPKLRFPEFRGAKGWTASQLIDLSSVGLSNGVFNDPKKVGDGYKLINVGDMYIDTTIIEDRLTLLTLSVSDFEANQVKHGDIFFTRLSLALNPPIATTTFQDQLPFNSPLINNLRINQTIMS